jgi:HlyD family secretion protein
MSARLLTAAAVGLLALVLAGCNKIDNGYQGWIEANLIFVAPDEVGRVQSREPRYNNMRKNFSAIVGYSVTVA